MTDELARKYEELKLREVEAKEKKEQDKKALKKGCLATIQISLVLFLLIIVLAVFTSKQDIDRPTEAKPQSSHKNIQSKRETQRPIERRTSAGVPIERRAYIDYRIDGDKIINLSVKRIRSNGHHCYSVNSIKLYRYPERIVVKCNGGKDKYRIQMGSMRVTRD